MSILTPDEWRLYANDKLRGRTDARSAVLERLWEAYVAMEANEAHNEAALLKCHEIIAGGWKSLGNFVPKDGEGTLGEEVARALKAAQSVEPCRWTYDVIMEAWDTACAKKWVFTNGGPAENNVRFCHCCGRPVNAEVSK